MKTKIILPKFVTDFMGVFCKKKFEIYIVGGAVRNLLLSRSTDNWDFATNAEPEEIQKLFKNAVYNNKYGTVTIPIEDGDNKLLFEVTPFRREADYKDSRHPARVEWAKTLEEDLARRDFTINALALGPEWFDFAHHRRIEGVATQIIDLFGGQEDLKNKIVKTVGDPNKRFLEDALRLIRAIRFASELGFLIDDATRDAIQKNANLIKKISWERIRDEFLKIIVSDHPSEGILFLRNTGLLKHILPELDVCFTVSQKSPKRHHIFDVGTHLVQSLKHCSSKDPIIRFATLIHDVGKAETHAKDEKTGVITFYNHEIVGAKLSKKIAQRFKLSKNQKDKLVKLVRYHMFSVSDKQTDRAVRRTIRNIGKENLDDLLALRVGDRIGSGATPTSWRTELFKKRLVEVQKVPFQIKDLKVDGNDVMKLLGIKPGPKIGEILQAIFDEVDEGKLKNERNVLLNRLTTFSQEKQESA